METRYKIILAVVVTIVLLVVGNLFLRFTFPPVVIAAEDFGVVVAGVHVSNALVTAVLVDVILVVLAIIGTRKMQLVPSGFQNFLEWVVATLYGFTESVAGSKWTPRFFAIVATIFLYVLTSNWFGLIPGLAAVGFCEEHHAEEGAEHAAVPYLAAPVLDHPEEEPRPPIGCETGQVIVPLFRSPSTDLNNNFALALISVGMTQVFGVMALGVGYFSKFINVEGMVRAFGPDEHGQRRGCGGMIGAFMFGGIGLFVGITELISEFAKLISFSFRLFGNIFAGEVLLLVATFLLPLILTIPFLGLEVFIGLIQAFIFYILTLAFFTSATITHGHGEENH